MVIHKVWVEHRVNPNAILQHNCATHKFCEAGTDAARKEAHNVHITTDGAHFETVVAVTTCIVLI